MNLINVYLINWQPSAVADTYLLMCVTTLTHPAADLEYFICIYIYEYYMKYVLCCHVEDYIPEKNCVHS